MCAMGTPTPVTHTDPEMRGGLGHRVLVEAIVSKY